jgi:hypothetical protein
MLGIILQKRSILNFDLNVRNFFFESFKNGRVKLSGCDRMDSIISIGPKHLNPENDGQETRKSNKLNQT